MAFVQTFKSSELIDFLQKIFHGHSNALSELKVEVNLPGIDPDRVQFSFVKNTLTIGQKNTEGDRVLKSELKGIVAISSKMKVALRLAEELAGMDDPVVIYGEHGTGKNLLAKTIHDLSDRKASPFISFPCGLFGKSKGDHQIDDYLAASGCGTLFLDGIHDLPVAVRGELSAKLMQRNRFRIIVALGVDPEKYIEDGEVSRQLLATLQGGYIELPPLCERREDIGMLAVQYISNYCQEHNLSIKTLSPDLLKMLHDYRWPGNVRELINTLDQLLITAQRRKTLFPRDLPDHIRIETTKSSSIYKQGL